MIWRTVVEPPPSQVGYPSFYAETHALRPMSAIVQLTSFIIAGVFERLPALRVVFGDVSVHQARSLAVRTNKDWQSDRVEVPWVTQGADGVFRTLMFVSSPSLTMRFRRIVTTPAERSAATRPRWWYSAAAIPYWDGVQAQDVFTTWSETERARCLAENARQFYPRLAARSLATSRSRPDATEHV